MCRNGTFYSSPQGPQQGTFLNLPQCLVVCPQAQFGNSQTRTCESCPEGCSSCTSANICTNCSSNYVPFRSSCIVCPSALELNIPKAKSLCGVVENKPTEVVDVPLDKILPPVLIVSALLLALGWLLWRHFRGRNKHLNEKLLSTEQEMMLTQHQLNALRKVWEIDWSEITQFNCIGSGAMGQVWRGQWRGMAVAVKMLTGVYSSLETLREELDREATMLQTLRHAHVVQFLGAGTTSDNMPFLVTELMELGALTGLLMPTQKHASPAAAQHALRNDDWVTKRRFALEIAAGMSLVHSLGRMHRDLKSGNVLATLAHSNFITLKVADFGTVTLAENWLVIKHESVLSSTQTTSLPLQRENEHGRSRTQLTKGIGTPLWMAPEILAGQRYGPSADVYSFAIVMWEIAAQGEPWPDVRGPFLQDTLCTLVHSGKRPAVDPSWPATYVHLMQRCWSSEPEARPTFKEVLAILGE
eukprot:m.200588 g.200588  ORF g.200588 m.200588 type:complete len:471 (+) comp15497_c12_seq1:120-1532(+)